MRSFIKNLLWRLRWRRPRRRFIARVDLGYFKHPNFPAGGLDGGLVFSSGPFADRKFTTVEGAEQWIGDREGIVYELSWERVTDRPSERKEP